MSSSALQGLTACTSRGLGQAVVGRDHGMDAVATPSLLSLKTLLENQVANLERARLRLSYGDSRCLIWDLVAEKQSKH